MDCTPTTLVSAARCFCGFSPKEAAAAAIYLACAWANASAPEPAPEPVLDPDVEAFVDAAGITDDSQIDALSGLVADLKDLPAVGVKYWDRQLVLYPFVGGAASPHSYNLIDPTQYQLTYDGTNVPTHSTTGMKGSGVAAGSGYANTHWRCPLANQDDVCVMVYAQARPQAGSARMVFGAAGVDRFTMRMDSPYTIPFTYDLNNASTGHTPANGADTIIGALFCQRQGDGSVSPSMRAAYQALAWSSSNSLRTAVPALDVFLLAWNTGAAGLFSDMEMSGFNALSQLTNAERLEYKGIWDDFEAALGRDHPLGV